MTTTSSKRAYIKAEQDYRKSPKNPLNMNTGGVEKWIDEWRAEQIAKGHILTEPAPALLTTAYGKIS